MYLNVRLKCTCLLGYAVSVVALMAALHVVARPVNGGMCQFCAAGLRRPGNRSPAPGGAFFVSAYCVTQVILDFTQPFVVSRSIVYSIGPLYPHIK